jgi:tetratricopeptide (TPR) repeat protein
MKALLLIHIFILIVIPGKVYSQKIPEDYFEEAEQFISEKNYSQAVQSYLYIIEQHPKNTLYQRSVYNLGWTYYKASLYDSAAAVFKEMLKGSFNETEALGGGIMDDPYTLYKHRACSFLSLIYTKQAKYDSALYYLSLSDTAFRYQHFCGNEMDDNHIRVAVAYANIYQKMNLPDKEIAALLPAVLLDDKEILERLKELLKNKTKVKEQLDYAINHIHTRKIASDKEIYTQYYIRFLDADIIGRYIGKEDKDWFVKRDFRKQLRESPFYKMIKAL